MNINVLHVVLSVVWSLGLGFIWYSPILFEKKWLEHTGMTKTKMKKAKAQMPRIFGLTALLYGVFAYMINLMFGGQGAMIAVQMAFWGWLAFTFIPFAVNNLFTRKSFELTLIDSFYQLGVFVGISFIVSYF